MPMGLKIVNKLGRVMEQKPPTAGKTQQTAKKK